VVIVLGLLACASGGQHAALGWSLGGEAHVFVADDRFARALYRAQGGRGDLMDTLARHTLVALDTRTARSATVLSATGAAPAWLTLARFHAPQTCGDVGIVTELVFAFPPGGAAGRSAPPSHATVVALLDAPPFAGGPGSRQRGLTTAQAQELLRRVAVRAEVDSRGARLGLLHRPVLNADQASDAGELVPLGSSYAVGFRGSFVPGGAGDTTLITGIAATDTALHRVRWVIRPQRMRLRGGMGQGVRFSLRGTVAGRSGTALLLIDEFADVAPRDSRATVVDPATRRVIAAQPLALRCP
jgi:hypothetical protein